MIVKSDGSVRRAIILCGTNRAGSRSREIARTIDGLYQRKGVASLTFDLADLASTVFHPHMYEGEIPAQVEAFVDALHAADALHVVCPEYNGSIPGALKLYFDLLPERGAVLSGCPVAIVGVSSGVTASKPIEHLQAMMHGHRAFVFPRAIQVVKCGRGDEDGPAVDVELEQRLDAQLAQFLSYAGALSSVRSLFAIR
jgi:chromate reductase